MVFPAWHITLTAAIAALASLLVTRWRFRANSWREALEVSLVVGVSVALWRLAGNVGPLNDDPIPLISPNDVLAPIATYVALAVHRGLRYPAAPLSSDSLAAWLVVVSFVANVVVI